MTPCADRPQKLDRLRRSADHRFLDTGTGTVEIDWKKVERQNDAYRAKIIGIDLPRGGYKCLS
jgi:hypothetical protein